MNLSEELYILYRKIKAALGWLIYLICSICPFHNNKIVFSAFEGGGYGCNPKYIAEEIIRRMHEGDKQYELVWLVNDTSKVFPLEIKAVKNNLWNRAYHLSTAKIWVDNSRKNYGTRKRKGQFYLQTWHGQIGIKPVGRMRGKAFSKIAEIVTRYDAKLEDVFLIGSEYARDIFTRSFYGEYLMKIGSPRCDILFNGRDIQYKNVRNMLNLPKDAKLIMYAPTFRGGNQHLVRTIDQGQFQLDFKRLKESLETRFGGTWYILLRLHPQLGVLNQTMHVEGDVSTFCIDISLKDDMYEYLAGIDAFLSDYSSAAMDAALMRIPVFTYADDINDYSVTRGELLYPFEKFPFPVSYDNKSLVRMIANFDETTYLTRLEKFFIDEGVMEDGKASVRIVDVIEKKCAEG